MYEGMGHPGDKQTVVIDIGTAYTKCGFAGEPAPRCIIRTEVSCPDLTETREVHCYKNAEDLHQLLVSFIHGVFFKHLLVSPKDRRVVIVESLLETTLFRETLAKVLFIHYEVVSVLFAPSHLVVLCALGVQTALVLDVGFKEAVIFPVYEGVPVLHAWQAQPLGGQAFHKSIRSMLAEKASAAGGDVAAVERLPESVIEDIKVRLCFVTSIERSGDVAAPPPPGADYRAQDVALFVPGEVRERAADVLFALDEERVSLATMCLDAVGKCSVDARLALAQNVVVVGGTSATAGFVSRLAEEIRRLAATPRYARYAADAFKFHAPPAKANFTAWLGGSIFSATELLVSRSLTRESYVKTGSVPDWSRIDQPPPTKVISYGI